MASLWCGGGRKKAQKNSSIIQKDSDLDCRKTKVDVNRIITTDQEAIQNKSTHIKYFQMAMDTTYHPNTEDYNLLTVIGRGCLNTATISLTCHKVSNEYIAIRKVKLEECAVDLKFLELYFEQNLQTNHYIPLELRDPLRHTRKNSNTHGDFVERISGGATAEKTMCYGKKRDMLQLSQTMLRGRVKSGVGQVGLGQLDLLSKLQITDLNKPFFRECYVINGEFTNKHYEIVMTQQLKHENLVTYLCSFVHDQELYLIMQLYAFGSCRDLIHAHFTQGLPEMAIAFILKSVLQALEYLHERSIIHRSVKASHILISATGGVVLSGLRHCCQMIQCGKLLPVIHEYPADVESLVWYSPELLEQNLAGYNCRSDIYSVGITGCELGNGIAPFSDMPATQMLYEKISGCRARLLDSTTLAKVNINLSQELENQRDDSGVGESANTENVCDNTTAYYEQRTFSHHFHHLVETCLEHDPRSRPSATQLLQHTFFKQTRKKTQDQLPELLQPVSPLTDIAAKLPKDTGQVESIANQLSVASIHSEWDFGELER